MAGKDSKRVVWGLDVASSAIKGIRMRLVGDRPEILEADIMPLEGPPPASMENPGRDKRIWQALQRFQEKHQIGSEEVVVGLPGSHFFTRPFNVFVVGTRSESDLVRYELEQHIPFGLDAVLWDYEAFPPEGPGDRELDGLLFAMKKDVLNNYLLSLSAADIEPRQVQAAPVALYNFVRHELNPGKPVLVVDIGAEGTTLLAIHGSRYWLRTINIGGNTTTAVLERAFPPHEVSREDAEAIKVNLRMLTRRAEVKERLMQSMRVLVGELRNAMEHLSREHEISFSKMILLGGASQTPGLSKLIAAEFPMHVLCVKGLGSIGVADSADAAYLKRNAPSFATAVGLALQGLGKGATRVNVIGATLVRRRSQTMVKRVAAVALVALGLFTVLLGAFSTWRSAALEKGARSLRVHTGPLATRYRQWQLLNRPGTAEQRLDRFEELARRRSVWLTVLDKVARMLPENNPNLRHLPWEDKMWVMRLEMSLPDKAGRRFKGVLDAGTPIRKDKTQLHYARRTVIDPLENDERKLFKNIAIERQQSTAELKFASKAGKERFLLLRLGFEVDTDKVRSLP